MTVTYPQSYDLGVLAAAGTDSYGLNRAKEINEAREKSAISAAEDDSPAVGERACVDCGAPATIIRTAPDGDDYETRRWVKVPLCAVCDAASRDPWDDAGAQDEIDEIDEGDLTPEQRAEIRASLPPTGPAFVPRTRAGFLLVAPETWVAVAHIVALEPVSRYPNVSRTVSRVVAIGAEADHGGPPTYHSPASVAALLDALDPPPGEPV